MAKRRLRKRRLTRVKSTHLASPAADAQQASIPATASDQLACAQMRLDFPMNCPTPNAAAPADLAKSPSDLASGPNVSAVLERRYKPPQVPATHRQGAPCLTAKSRSSAPSWISPGSSVAQPVRAPVERPEWFLAADK